MGIALAARGLSASAETMHRRGDHTGSPGAGKTHRSPASPAEPPQLVEARSGLDQTQRMRQVMIDAAVQWDMFNQDLGCWNARSPT
jgi:hypothetical protein